MNDIKDVLIKVIDNYSDKDMINKILIVLLQNINMNDLMKLNIDTLYDINIYINKLKNIKNNEIKNKLDICFSSKLIMIQVNNRYYNKRKYNICTYYDKIFSNQKQYNHILYYKHINNINKCKYCFKENERIILSCKKCCYDKYYICNECAYNKLCIKDNSLSKL